MTDHIDNALLRHGTPDNCEDWAMSDLYQCHCCDIWFRRPSNVPMPHNVCGRCYEELSGIAEEKVDNVNHPDHYQSDDGIECIDAIRAALGLEGFVAHCRGTAIKYAWRSGKKAEHAEDLRKACVYLTWAAEALEETSNG